MNPRYRWPSHSRRWQGAQTSRHPGRAAIAIVLLCLARTPATDAAADEPDSWLDEVAFLITEEERAAYLALSRDYQRHSFRQAFWRQRDAFPETGRNEFQETWDARLELARDQLQSLEGDRARAFLLISVVPTAISVFALLG